jgi:hypothetical protein
MVCLLKLLGPARSSKRDEACKLQPADAEGLMAPKDSTVRKEEDRGSQVVSDGHLLAADECSGQDESDDLEDHDDPETDDDRAGVL